MALFGIDPDRSNARGELVMRDLASSPELSETIAEVVESTAVGQVQTISDSIGEWWISPLSVRDASRGRVVGGAVSADKGDGTADIVVWERTDAGTTRRYAIGTCTTDDHNVPAVLILPWGGVLVVWNDHNRDNIVRWKVSNQAGDLVSLTKAPLQQSNIGFGVSYAQIVLDDTSTNDSAVVRLMLRDYRGNGWSWELTTLTIDRATGVGTRGTLRRLFSASNLDADTEQMYAAWAPAHSEGDQIMRAVVGFNPAAGRHDIHAFEVNLTTGDVTSLTNPALTANVYTATNVPIIMEDQPPLIADVASGNSRRLFYPRPGPASWAIGYADWATATPDSATYKVREKLAGSGLSISAGYASTPDASAWDASLNGFGFEMIGLDLGVASIPSQREIARRYTDATNRQFTVRPNTSGTITVNVNRVGNNPADYTTTVAVPGLFTDRVNFRFEVLPNTGGGTIKFFTSDDDGDTWDQLGADVSIGTYATISDSTAPLVVGSTSGALQVPMQVESARYFGWNGTVETDLAGINFAALESGSTTYPGIEGETWTLSGDATIVGWVTHNLGVAGPRVGYTPLANYIGGLFFPNPSTDDDVILVARRNAGNTESTIERWVKVGSAYELGEIVATSEHYLSRPHVPVDGGSLAAIWSEITEYAADNYEDYQSTLRIA